MEKKHCLQYAIKVVVDILLYKFLVYIKYSHIEDLRYKVCIRKI